MIDLLVAAAIAAHPYQLVPVDTTVAIEEDSPQWDCRTLGNFVCGPDNAQGVTLGDYSNDDVEIS